MATRRLVKQPYLLLFLLYNEDANATEYARRIADAKGLKLVNPTTGKSTILRDNLPVGTNTVSIELNNDYFRDAVGYLKAEDEKLETVSLFDLMGVAE